MLGIVRVPTTAQVATALPDREPIMPQLTTATFAGPPGLPRKMLSAKPIMKRVAPVACKKAPKTTNRKTYVNMTFIAMPKTPWLCRNV
jgi:hypothetical protein